MEKLKPLSFREFDLMDTKARFYFRNQALASKSGQLPSRRHAHSDTIICLPCSCQPLVASLSAPTPNQPSMSVLLLLAAESPSCRGFVSVFKFPCYMRGFCFQHTDVFVLIVCTCAMGMPCCAICCAVCCAVQYVIQMLSRS